MGLFSFIKDAGAAVFSGSNEAKEEANWEREKQIEEFVCSNMKDCVSGFKAKYDGETATIMGDTTSAENREKVILAVGNLKGIANVDDQLTISAGAPTADPKFYVVKSGDSLSKIAQEQCGDPMKYTAIFEANKPMLSDPDQIYPGQTLRIPDNLA